jgi:hypothetical protein
LGRSRGARGQARAAGAAARGAPGPRRQVSAQLDDAIKEAQDLLAPLDADAKALLSPLLLNPLKITTAPRR